MKKLILSIATFMILSSCQKNKCKERQAIDLQKQLEEFQKELSNTNLSTLQIEELKKRFDEKQKEILAECN